MSDRKLILAIVVLVVLNIGVSYYNFKPKVAIKDYHVITLENKNVLPVANDLPIKEAVLNTVASYGIDKRIADRIITCESRWNERAVNEKTDCKGLWQIHPIHRLSDELMFDPIKSTKWSVEKALRDGSFSAWSCY